MTKQELYWLKQYTRALPDEYGCVSIPQNILEQVITDIENRLDSLTVEEWKRAFHRAAICADWQDVQMPNASTGPNGEGWCADAIELYDPESNARLILDNEVIEQWNRDCGYKYPLNQILKV